MDNPILRFIQNFKIVEIDFHNSSFRPSTTVLNYLRSHPATRGTKEGCGEGDCGACTVVIAELSEGKLQYKAVNSCLTFLPSLHGKMLITVEDLAENPWKYQTLHPVQKAFVEENASQCGFCTPGFVMSTFAMVKNNVSPSPQNIIEGLEGNLCRCTGYQSIFQAAEKSLQQPIEDRFDKVSDKIIDMLSSLNQNKASLDIQAHNQHYFLAASLDDALRFKKEHPDAVIVNGATDIAVKQNKKFVYPSTILDISQVEELKPITTTPSGFTIGAGVSLEALKKSEVSTIPIIEQSLQHFASLQIRNTGTLGGNLCNASPVGDLIPAMIALKARAIIQSSDNQRVTDFEQFITGYRKTCLAPDELLTAIFIPKPTANTRLRFFKVSNRRNVDISTVSLACSISLQNNIVTEIILAYGGMAAQVKRAAETEKFLMGKTIDEPTIQQAKENIETEFTPISDARAGDDYRKTIAKNLLEKALISIR